MRREVNTHLISGLIGLAIVAVFWMRRGRLSDLSAMFPDAVLVILALLSLALIVMGFVKPEMRALFTEGDRPRMVITAATILAWILAIPRLGFFVSSLLGFAFLTWYLGRAQRRVTLPTSLLLLVINAAVVGIFYFVFTRFLHVRLPQGMFF